MFGNFFKYLNRFVIKILIEYFIRCSNIVPRNWKMIRALWVFYKSFFHVVNYCSLEEGKIKIGKKHSPGVSRTHFIGTLRSRSSSPFETRLSSKSLFIRTNIRLNTKKYTKCIEIDRLHSDFPHDLLWTRIKICRWFEIFWSFATISTGMTLHFHLHHNQMTCVFFQCIPPSTPTSQVCNSHSDALAFEDLFRIESGCAISSRRFYGRLSRARRFAIYI